MRSFLFSLKRRLRKSRSFYLFLGQLMGLCWNIPMGLARLFRGTDDNLVVFSSLDYRAYGDSPRLISERLHAIRPDIKIVWLFKDPGAARQRYSIPDYVRVLPFSPRHPVGACAMARARVVVDSYNKKFYLRFPGRNQLYIQTWHGDRPFKKIGFDHGDQHLRMLEERCSLFLTGSDYGERIIRRAFHYNGEILKAGMPRNDILLHADSKLCAEIRARLGLDANTRALLYAPTFRDSETRAHKQQRVPLDIHHTLDALERSTGKEWKCLVRAHYMSFGIPLDDDTGRLIPVSDYPEMAELLLAADALLTDYSSCAGDYVLLGRPIFLYQEDLDDYRGNSRDLYVDMADTPFWTASTPEELDRIIESATPERVQENCDAIMRFYGMAESGRATQAAVDYIIAGLQSYRGETR